MIRKTVHFSGRVQGVGFRWTASHLAHAFTIAGYVKNMPDRSVEMVVEGEQNQVNAFIDAVAHEMSSHITNTKTGQLDPTGEFSRFEIRY